MIRLFTKQTRVVFHIPFQIRRNFLNCLQTKDSLSVYIKWGSMLHMLRKPDEDVWLQFIGNCVVLSKQLNSLPFSCVSQFHLKERARLANLRNLAIRLALIVIMKRPWDISNDRLKPFLLSILCKGVQKKQRQNLGVPCSFWFQSSMFKSLRIPNTLYVYERFLPHWLFPWNLLGIVVQHWWNKTSIYGISFIGNIFLRYVNSTTIILADRSYDSNML